MLEGMNPFSLLGEVQLARGVRQREGCEKLAYRCGRVE
jgi:hypothetical protein